MSIDICNEDSAGHSGTLCAGCGLAECKVWATFSTGDRSLDVCKACLTAAVFGCERSQPIPPQPSEDIPPCEGCGRLTALVDDDGGPWCSHCGVGIRAVGAFDEMDPGAAIAGDPPEGYVDITDEWARAQSEPDEEPAP
jgi:hypothetical protein